MKETITEVATHSSAKQKSIYTKTKHFIVINILLSTTARKYSFQKDKKLI